MRLKEIGLSTWNLLTILGSIVNIIGEPVWSFKKKENSHFHYEYHVHTSSEDEENSYGLDLGLLIIS